jgi:hypothetical protein
MVREKVIEGKFGTLNTFVFTGYSLLKSLQQVLSNMECRMSTVECSLWNLA